MASLITASTLAAFVWTLRSDPGAAPTVAFMTLAFAQTFHLGNARSAGTAVSLRRISANGYALGAVAVSIALQLAAMYLEPLAGVLRVTPLSPDQWLVVVALSAVPAVAGQMVKQFQRSPAVEVSCADR